MVIILGTTFSGLSVVFQAHNKQHSFSLKHLKIGVMLLKTPRVFRALMLRERSSVIMGWVTMILWTSFAVVVPVAFSVSVNTDVFHRRYFVIAGEAQTMAPFFSSARGHVCATMRNLHNTRTLKSGNANETQPSLSILFLPDLLMWQDFCWPNLNAPEPCFPKAPCKKHWLTLYCSCSDMKLHRKLQENIHTSGFMSEISWI